MANGWYYQMLGEEFGPVPESEIRQLIDIGTLSDDDLIRRENQRNWMAASQMQTAATVSSSGDEPAELGDLSELSFSFEEASELPEIEDDSSLLQMDEIKFEDETTRPQARPKSSVVETAEESDSWYYDSMGDVMGPMSMRMLIRMAEKGMLGESDKVRSGESGDWTIATDVPELAASFLSSLETQDVPPSRAKTTAPAKTERPSKKSPTGSEHSKSGRPARPAPRSEAGRKPGRKKKKSAAADVSEDLFNEVFSEESPAPRSTMAAKAPVLSEATEAADTEIEPAPKHSPAAASAIPSNSPMQSIVAAASEKSLPKKKPPKQKREFSVPSFNMPEPKTLGIGAGVLVVVLLIAGFFTGTISLSMLGFSPNAKSALTRFRTEYKALAASSISNDSWKAFGDRVRPVLRQVQDAIGANESRTTEDEMYGRACGVMLRLVNVRASDSEKQAEIFKEFEELMGSE
ncbi:MAG: GYF domain-containing protein [Planctomycetaceae bacterium]